MFRILQRQSFCGAKLCHGACHLAKVPLVQKGGRMCHTLHPQDTCSFLQGILWCLVDSVVPGSRSTRCRPFEARVGSCFPGCHQTRRIVAAFPSPVCYESQATSSVRRRRTEFSIYTVRFFLACLGHLCSKMMAKILLLACVVKFCDDPGPNKANYEKWAE